MLGVVIYRGVSIAHERWRRRILRQEIAEIRQARLDSSEAFQESMREQIAILDRIVEITDSLLTDGIIDPMTALENVRLVTSHAHHAKGLAEDAIAEVRIETGSTTFEVSAVGIRTEIEDVTAQFIRAGQQIATSGPQSFAETDPAVFRIVIRNLISRAIEFRAEEIDVSVARDGDRVICTVADDGDDRSRYGLSTVSPVSRALTNAVGATLEAGYALGWNRYSMILPAAEPQRPQRRSLDPLDVLGDRPRDEATAEPTQEGPMRDKNGSIVFHPDADRTSTESVASRRRESAPAR